MSEKTNQILMSVTTQATLPLFLKDQILLEMIMTYLTINLSIAWYLLIEVPLLQTYLELSAYI